MSIISSISSSEAIAVTKRATDIDRPSVVMALRSGRRAKWRKAMVTSGGTRCVQPAGSSAW